MSDARIITRNGTRYVVTRRADHRGWKVAIWCGCVLGPHWHQQPDARTLADVGTVTA